MASHQAPAEDRQPGILWGHAENAQSFLLHQHLLGQRLYLYSLARFLVAASIVVGALFAKHVVGIDELPAAGLLKLAGLLALYNLGVFYVVRSRRRDAPSPAAAHFLRAVLHVSIAADFLFLTVALWLVGGAKSPFQVFYIFNVILACVLLSRRSAYAHALFAYSLLATLVLGQQHGWIPRVFPAGAVSGGQDLDDRYVVTILAVQGMLFALTTVLLTGLTKLLRQGERRLRRSNAELEQLWNMQRDFSHIAMHNIKAPVHAVVSLLGNLKAGLCGELTEQQAHWVGRCETRLSGLTVFLRDLQKLSSLEPDAIQDQTEPVDVAALLHSLVEENLVLAEQRRHTLTVDVPDGLPPVRAISRLLREAVANFVTNAIKYTPEGGKIVVRAAARRKSVRIEVEDNGIGISQKDQKKLFSEFVRILRPDSATGEVEGSGLGLSIARRIAEVHGGRVELRSALDIGSTFAIEIPI
jgi:signal transduction histidine kinase